MEGKIKAKGVATTQFDDDGNPVGIPALFGFAVPCKYHSANRNDVVDIGDGTFVQASYIITLKDMSFNSKQIQLIDNRGEVVCEKDVKSLEVLESIKRIKIVI
jgi:hypothetical protein